MKTSLRYRAPLRTLAPTPSLRRIIHLTFTSNAARFRIGTVPIRRHPERSRATERSTPTRLDRAAGRPSWYGNGQNRGPLFPEQLLIGKPAKRCFVTSPARRIERRGGGAWGRMEK